MGANSGGAVPISEPLAGVSYRRPRVMSDGERHSLLLASAMLRARLRRCISPIQLHVLSRCDGKKEARLQVTYARQERGREMRGLRVERESEL
jgi:hypothetical protein